GGRRLAMAIATIVTELLSSTVARCCLSSRSRRHERVTNAGRRQRQETVLRFQLAGEPKVTHFIAAEPNGLEFVSCDWRGQRKFQTSEDPNEKKANALSHNFGQKKACIFRSIRFSLV